MFVGQKGDTILVLATLGPTLMHICIGLGSDLELYATSGSSRPNNAKHGKDTGVLAQSVERPPHNRQVVGLNPGRVIPKDVKRRELLLPCLAFNNKG